VINEADTCRKYVLPNLMEAGWDDEPHSSTEQKSFTDRPEGGKTGQETSAQNAHKFLSREIA
jgi:type I site-specific restriction endonuclease